MAVVYTKHAEEMLFVRNIKKKLVSECTVNPNIILPTENNKKIYLKDFGVNYLKLVVSEKERIK